tara:strand:- start:36 stop:302 length:267 start_codon:yes stop_codon:yes gene_type:complete
MTTRRRTSAVKSTTAKKSPRTVVTKKSTVTTQSVNKVTPIEAVKVTETPVKEEKKVKRSLTELDGLELILLPLLYLEKFTQLLLKNQF